MSALLLGAISAWAMRTFAPDFDASIRQGLGDQSPWWLPFLSLAIAWWLLLSGILEFFRWAVRFSQKRQRSKARKAFRAARPPKQSPATVPPVANPREAAYRALSHEEKLVLRCFIDAGVRKLAQKVFVEELDKAAKRDSAPLKEVIAAVHRLVDRGFLLRRYQSWEASDQFSLSEQSFRELSEHPDWIGSPAPVRHHLK